VSLLPVLLVAVFKGADLLLSVDLVVVFLLVVAADFVAVLFVAVLFADVAHPAMPSEANKTIDADTAFTFKFILYSPLL
jgi:hypothetical protein